MHTEHVFSSVIFGKWKQQARDLKRAGDLSHHQALELIAKANRFKDWHHVVTEAKLNRTSETAFRSGLVVAYDIKDATQSWVQDDSFVDDSRVYLFCQNDVLAWYQRGDEEAEGDEKRAIPSDPAEYMEDFEEWCMNVHFFRYVGSSLPQTPRKVLPLLQERCFFSPMFFWHNGQFIDPWRDLAVDNVLDMSGSSDTSANS